MVNINYLRHDIPVQWQFQEAISLFSNDFVIAKHRANLMVFNRFSKSFNKIYIGTMANEKKQGY